MKTFSSAFDHHFLKGLAHAGRQRASQVLTQTVTLFLDDLWQASREFLVIENSVENLSEGRNNKVSKRKSFQFFSILLCFAVGQEEQSEMKEEKNFFFFFSFVYLLLLSQL